MKASAGSNSKEYGPGVEEEKRTENMLPRTQDVLSFNAISPLTGGAAKPPRKRTVTPAKIRKRLYRMGKDMFHQLKYAGNQKKTMLFIVGCQRSGSDLVLNVFDQDVHTKVYGEVSKLTSDDPHRQLRLNPLHKVAAALTRIKAPLIVMKPLVESQNILQLLQYFPGSFALWLYRDYRGVASSHIQKWGNKNSINDLRAIVEARPNNWRYEGVSDRIRGIVLKHFAEDMNPYDAAALYWYVRNNCFFHLRLEQNPKVLLCRYEELVTNPRAAVAEIYAFLGQEFPGDKIVRSVHTSSVKNGRGIPVSPAIERLCHHLLVRLDQNQGLKVRFSA